MNNLNIENLLTKKNLLIKDKLIIRVHSFMGLLMLIVMDVIVINSLHFMKVVLIWNHFCYFVNFLKVVAVDVELYLIFG
jgi:hypothetical protein